MLSECSKKVVWRWLLVTSINAQNPEPETTHLYSLPAENAEDGDQGGQEEKTQAGHQHQHHSVILAGSLMQRCFKFNILYFILQNNIWIKGKMNIYLVWKPIKAPV